MSLQVLLRESESKTMKGKRAERIEVQSKEGTGYKSEAEGK